MGQAGGFGSRCSLGEAKAERAMYPCTGTLPCTTPGTPPATATAHDRLSRHRTTGHGAKECYGLK